MLGKMESVFLAFLGIVQAELSIEDILNLIYENLIYTLLFIITFKVFVFMWAKYHVRNDGFQKDKVEEYSDLYNAINENLEDEDIPEFMLVDLVYDVIEMYGSIELYKIYDLCTMSVYFQVINDEGNRFTGFWVDLKNDTVHEACTGVYPEWEEEEEKEEEEEEEEKEDFVIQIARIISRMISAYYLLKVVMLVIVLVVVMVIQGYEKYLSIVIMIVLIKILWN